MSIAGQADTALLEARRLTVHYGPIEAVHCINLRVGQGQVVALIGANGAGKSSTLAALSGMVRPSVCTILLRGREITHEPAPRRVAAGVTLVPEGRRIFANLSVLENLELGAYLERDRARYRNNLERVFAIFPPLAERRRQLAATLSGGEQQMLAIGRALMSNPLLLLLDEPSLGLAPFLVTEIFEKIQQLNREGITILLVEQNAHKSLAIADWAYVMETGTIAHEGAGPALARDERVRGAYLGAT